MARTKKADQIDVSSTTKEAVYLLMYYLTGVKKEAYKFASKGESLTTNENSLKSMGAAFHNSNKVKLLEPLIKAKFINQATKALENEGYKILSPAEAITLATKQANLLKPENEKDKLIEQLKTQIETLEEERRNDDNQSQKNENVLSDLTNIDLGDKDAMLKELNTRYNTANDDKIKNDIAKMIIDVNNMKKAEIQEDKQLKHYYLPLRKCSDCPNLHTIYSTNNIAK